MDELKQQIATNAAEFGVERYGRKLSSRRQARLYDICYDLVIGSLLSFEEVSNARAIRTRTLVSEN